MEPPQRSNRNRDFVPTRLMIFTVLDPVDKKWVTAVKRERWCGNLD